MRPRMTLLLTSNDEFPLCRPLVPWRLVLDEIFDSLVVRQLLISSSKQRALLCLQRLAGLVKPL